MEEKKANSLIEKLKAKAKQQENYGGHPEHKPADMGAGNCPNCGAGRAKHDGLTHFAYCGFEFMAVKLTDGIHIKPEDNSKI